MERQLTVKELAPYLPHRLMGIIKGKIVTVDTMHQYTLQSEPRVHGYTYCGYDNFKPLLLPLSCLTEEITVDGGKFVPIVELANIAFPNYGWALSSGRAVCSRLNFGFDSNSFWAHNYITNTNITIYNQLELFQKLYEWHFDLENLIPQNLAIDKRKHLNR